MPIRIPPKRRVRRALPQIRVTNPGKGLNTLISDTLIKDEEASDLSNIMFVESGAVSKRTGYTAVGNALSNNPKGLGILYTTSVRQLLTIDGTELKYLNGSTWTAIAGAAFTTAKETTFVQCRDAVYIWNGTDAGAKYDGSTLSRPTTTPSAAFGIYYAGYQIVAGTSSKVNRLYISVSTDPSDFTNAAGELSTSAGVPGASAFAGTGANYIDIADGDGDKITGLTKFQDDLIIFKERSTYSMSFDSTGATPIVVPVTNSIGCVSHKSIDNVENDAFFLTRNGYYVLGNEPNYFQVVRNNELSQRINPTIGQITEGNLAKAVSIYSGFKFFSSIPYGGTTTNNRLLTYDRRFLAWAISTNINANAFTEFIGTDNVKHLYFAADDAPRIYELDTSYSDNGSAIDSYWQGKAHSLDDETENTTFWIDCTLIFRQVSGSVTIKLIDDNGETVGSSSISSSQDLYGTMGYTWMMGDYPMGGAVNPTTTTNTATSTNNVPYRIPLNKYARTMKVRVENSNNNENFVLLGYVLTARKMSHYHFPSSQVLR